MDNHLQELHTQLNEEILQFLWFERNKRGIVF